MLPRDDHGLTDLQIRELHNKYGQGPHITVDVLVPRWVFENNTWGLQVLLVERGNAPYAGSLALPGGFVEQDEEPIAAALRELAEETGVTQVTQASLIQLGAYAHPLRDPRSRTIGIVYLAQVPCECTTVRAGDDAAQAGYFPWGPSGPLRDGSTTTLAFDHDLIVRDAWQRLRMLAMCSSWPLGLLPGKFTTECLGGLYELWGHLNLERLVHDLLELGWIRALGTPGQWHVAEQCRTETLYRNRF